MKRKYLNILAKITVVAAVFSFTSCKQEGGLAPEYMPDMYRSPAVEPYVDYGELRGNYSNDSLTNLMTARQPVEGTIHRGFIPYGYKNTPEDYLLAGQNLKNPIAYSDEVVKEGEELYGMFCVHCHGKTGQGDGTLVQRDKFPPLPIKFAPTLELEEGKMFHTITYGKGLMGSHAPQLNQEERWKLIHYIRAKFMGKTPTQNLSNQETGITNSSSAILAFTGNTGNDLDLIFDFFDEENPEYEALPSNSPSIVLPGVTFKQASAKLKIEESKNILDMVAAKLLEEENKGLKILLGGHTHKGPNENLNVTLSEKRANAVKNYLVDRGVEAARVLTKGYGYSKPLTTESGKEARIKNRRTEISVIK